MTVLLIRAHQKLSFEISKYRSLQLDEERIKALTEELKLKRSLLEDAEASYQKRLDDEIQRFPFTSCLV